MRMTDTDDIPDIFRESVAKNRKTEADIIAQKAAAAISELTDQYLLQVHQDLRTLKQALQKARQSTPDTYFAIIRDTFFLKMHDMKGQGATFGYPLLTEIGGYACDYLRYKKEITPQDLDKLAQLVNDIDRVLSETPTDTGGKIEDEIRSHLTDLTS